MTGILKEQIGDNPVLVTLLILALFVYFCYREYPELMRRIKGRARSEMNENAIVERLAASEQKVDDLTERTARDYYRLNSIEERLRKQETGLTESLQERQLLMTGMLACLKGLQEQGVDGPVTEAITSIEKYLVEQSHK